jgi:hypothetical protein
LKKHPEILEYLNEIDKTNKVDLILDLHNILEMNGIKYKYVDGTEIMVGELPENPKVEIEIDWINAKKT